MDPTVSVVDRALVMATSSEWVYVKVVLCRV